jgi:hypothetical protein
MRFYKTWETVFYSKIFKNNFKVITVLVKKYYRIIISALR